VVWLGARMDGAMDRESLTLVRELGCGHLVFFWGLFLCGSISLLLALTVAEVGKSGVGGTACRFSCPLTGALGSHVCL
jgi:hypothetical protein